VTTAAVGAKLSLTGRRAEWPTRCRAQDLLTTEERPWWT
jgi:hypothetical protein